MWLPVFLRPSLQSCRSRGWVTRREKIKKEEGGEGFECSYKRSSWKIYNISRESYKKKSDIYVYSLCECVDVKCAWVRGTFSVVCFNQFVFSMPAGRILRGVLAEFGTLVVPRIVFRSPAVVTGSPPSFSHYVRARGRWWTSLSMKMVRASSTVCTEAFYISFVLFFLNSHFPPIFKWSAKHSADMFCIYNFCFFCVNVAVLVYHSTYFNTYVCGSLAKCLNDERLQTVIMSHPVWQIGAGFKLWWRNCIH